MDNVNKTLYIPLYAKAYVSRKGLFLSDKTAEAICLKEKLSLSGKAASRWLAYYLGIRAAVYDSLVKQKAEKAPDTVVIHIGCGLDSRAQRVGFLTAKWYDLDFPEVINERKKYFGESDRYKLIGADALNTDWLKSIPEKESAVIVMEGVSMYMPPEKLKSLYSKLCSHFDRLTVLTDCYTALGAKMSEYKNPVKEVGVSEVFAIDDPVSLQTDGLLFIREHDMSPDNFINELPSAERLIFRRLYAGGLSKKLYRLYEYGK